MSEIKTQPTDASVTDFIAAVPDERRRREAQEILGLMTEVTGETAVLWGPSIIGFGTMRYTYASGRSGDWPRVGFSPRKAAISLYGLRDSPASTALLEKLGRHTHGAGCVYVKRLDQIDLHVLRELVALAHDREEYVGHNQ